MLPVLDTDPRFVKRREVSVVHSLHTALQDVHGIHLGNPKHVQCTLMFCSTVLQDVHLNTPGQSYTCTVYTYVL